MQQVDEVVESLLRKFNLPLLPLLEGAREHRPKDRRPGGEDLLVHVQRLTFDDERQTRKFVRLREVDAERLRLGFHRCDRDDAHLRNVI